MEEDQRSSSSRKKGVAAERRTGRAAGGIRNYTCPGALSGLHWSLLGSHLWDKYQRAGLAQGIHRYWEMGLSVSPSASSAPAGVLSAEYMFYCLPRLAMKHFTFLSICCPGSASYSRTPCLCFFNLTSSLCPAPGHWSCT